MNRFDVAIAGAGPAGSSAAIRLANAGLKVLLIERKKFPRAKLCGEFISPECIGHFEELSVMPAMLRAGGVDIGKTVFYARGGRSFTVESEWFGTRRDALGLSRAEMDLRLMDRAREAGVEVREDTSFVAPLESEGRVHRISIRSVSRGEESIQAAITIDATGRTRAVSGSKRKESPARVAFKTHLSGVEIETGACEIYSYPGGYGGCNGIEKGLTNLCFIASSAQVRACSSDPQRVLSSAVFQNARAAKALAHAKVETEWLAVPIDRLGRAEAAPSHGVIAIGDSAAFIDPFTGSGMLMAFESAKIAAESIIKYLPAGPAAVSAEYTRRYARRFDGRLRFSGLLRRAAFMPFLADATIFALSSSSRLQRYVARSTRASAPAPGKV